MVERKQSKRGAKPKGNGLSSPTRRLYDKVAVKDPVRAGFYLGIADIVRTARASAYRATNFAMVAAYWQIGRMIVEEEQKGNHRAAYGKLMIEGLSQRLTREFGKGYDLSNLRHMRQFFLAYPIRDAVRLEFTTACPATGSDSIGVRRELTWTHYRLLLRVEKPEARAWYMNEAADQNWSTRALERQIGSLYYERLLMSRCKRAPVEKEAKQKTGELAAQPEDFIKDPYVLEFLGIPDAHPFRESELEQAIIGKLQAFLLELGKGFAFVARQQRISTETKDFFIDLVFYNYILKCFVLIDLKTGELTHQDIGQMDMYVRLYEDQRKNPGDNPAIGLILCTGKDATVVKYSVLSESKQLFASQYRLVLPTEEELRREIERERDLAVREQEARYG